MVEPKGDAGTTKFTPGPWKIGDMHQGKCIHSSNGSADDALVIASLPAFRDFRGRADAYLIAATPEMYEALQVAALYLAGCVDEETPMATGIYNKISAVLAKARGENL